MELEARVGDLEDNYGSLKRNNDSIMASQASKLAGAERRVELLQGELTNSTSTAQERLSTINSLREQIDRLEEARAKAGGSSMDSTQWGVVRDELKKQADHGQLKSMSTANARLTSEVNKLRARNQNLEILREEKRDLERKLTRLEEYRDLASRLQGELDAAKAEREAW